MTMQAKTSTQEITPPRIDPTEKAEEFFAFGVGQLRRPMAYKCHHSSCGFEAESSGTCPVDGHGELAPSF